MSRYHFHTLDVFTETRFGGNPLAVFTDGQGLSDATMQAIAREMNLSETVFVLPPRKPQAVTRLRIFTPVRELPFAGHPTVGSGFLLAKLGRIPLANGKASVLLEEEVGLVGMNIESRAGKPLFAQLAVAALPEVGPPPPSRAELAKILSLEPEDILVGAEGPQAVSCGVPFLYVPVRDRATLARAYPAPADWHALLGNYFAREATVFCHDPELPGSQIRARTFCPEAGIIEDPATGASCAALGGYLAMRDSRAEGTLRWVIEQGFEMGRPSLMYLEVDKAQGRITAVRVGGYAVLVSEGELQVGD